MDSDGRDRRSWFERNWLWAVPLLGCLSALALPLCVCGGCLGMICAGLRGQTSVMVEALERAKTHPDVVAALGEPVRPGVPKASRMSTDNDSGFADVRVPLEGPNGTAMLHIVARGAGGTWTYDKLEVTLDADGTVIELPLDDVIVAPDAGEGSGVGGEGGVGGGAGGEGSGAGGEGGGADAPLDESSPRDDAPRENVPAPAPVHAEPEAVATPV